jgi:EAL domain-containing protein (putative c-di-GMP-specific phosphodiesterase class I)
MPNACGACRESGDLFPFTMAFQPVIDLQEQRIDAYEALVRGVEGAGAGAMLAQVTPQNMYAFDQACRIKAIEMAARLGLDRRLNINFQPNAVYEPKACIRRTLETAAKTGFPLQRLTFEIVENEDIADAAHLCGIIEEYKRCGFAVALDDFATGYSGLSRLVQLKPDIVKIDRALVADCDVDAGRLAVIGSMISLGEQLGIKVVLEGVERRGELDALKGAGARFMQGFYFARPAFESLTGDSAVFSPALR